MLNHVRDATRTESHILDATGVDVTFVDDFCIQVLRHVDSTCCDQIKVPRHATQNAQWAVGEQLQHFYVNRLRFVAVIKDFRQIRTGTAHLVNRCIQLVNNHAGDGFVLQTTKVGAGYFQTLFQLFWGISTWCYNENDFCVQRFSNVKVHIVSERLLAGWYQTFDQNGVCIFGFFRETSNDLLQQNISLAATDQVLSKAQGERLQRFHRAVSTDAAGSQIRTVAAVAWLADWFEEVDVNAFALHRTYNTQTDACQADTGADWN